MDTGNNYQGYKKWFDTNTENGINFVGLKWAVDTTSSAGGTTYGVVRLYTKFYLAFKDPK